MGIVRIAEGGNDLQVGILPNSVENISTGYVTFDMNTNLTHVPKSVYIRRRKNSGDVVNDVIRKIYGHDL